MLNVRRRRDSVSLYVAPAAAMKEAKRKQSVSGRDFMNTAGLQFRERKDYLYFVRAIILTLRTVSQRQLRESSAGPDAAPPPLTSHGWLPSRRNIIVSPAVPLLSQLFFQTERP